MTRVSYDVRGVNSGIPRAPSSSGEPAARVALPDHLERFRLYSADELGSFPSVEWLVPGYLAARELTVLFGPGGNYKSFLALHWSAELARDGHDVVYIAAEGVSGMQARVTAWKAAHEVETLPRLQFLPSEVVAQDGDDVDALLDAIGHFGITPALVVVDTLARNFVGGSENDPKDLGLFVAGMERIRRALGCAVLVLHHTTKDGTTVRGSDALRNATFAMLKMAKVSNGAQLTCDRMKDAPQPPPVRIGIDEVAVPALDTTSLVLDWASPQSGSTDEPASVERSRAEHLVLAALRKEPGLSQRRLRESLRGEGKGAGSGKVEAAVQELTSRGLVERREGGLYAV